MGPKPNFRILVSEQPGLWSWFVTPCCRLTQKHFGSEETEEYARAKADAYAKLAYGRLS